jgi:excinuclease ABC subunit B
MYADAVTPSMAGAIGETERRREKQTAYNTEHGIVPKTIIKNVRDLIEISSSEKTDTLREDGTKMTRKELGEAIAKLEKEMLRASKLLEFEYAAVLRDRIIKLRAEESKAK